MLVVEDWSRHPVRNRAAWSRCHVKAPAHPGSLLVCSSIAMKQPFEANIGPDRRTRMLAEGSTLRGQGIRLCLFLDTEQLQIGPQHDTLRHTSVLPLFTLERRVLAFPIVSSCRGWFTLTTKAMCIVMYCVKYVWIDISSSYYLFYYIM